MTKLRGLRAAKKKEPPKPRPVFPRQCAKRLIERKYEARSHTDRHKIYTVRYKKNGNMFEWSCTCQAFVYRKVGVLSCKHIEQVKKQNHCSWRSDVGPEKAVVEVASIPVCPRCNGATVELEPEEETEA